MSRQFCSQANLSKREPCDAYTCSLLSVPVNSTTHNWEVTDPSLGASLALGPSGATVLTRDPVKGQDAYEQALRVGPDGVVFGPNDASAHVNRTADLAQGTFGIDNLHLGPTGVLVNNGSPLNSSVKVRCYDTPIALALQAASFQRLL